MANSRVSLRFAKSLISLAEERNELDLVNADMLLVSSVCEENRDLEVLLASPIVKADKKKVILNSIFASSVGEITSTFINLLTDKKRESLLSDIANTFVLLLKEHKHITIAEVTTAVALDEATRVRVMEIVTKMGATSIELNEIIDPEVMGGFILRVGDKQIDASVLRQFADLKQEFSKNPYVADF